MQKNLNLLNNMFPVFSHIVERICTPAWRMDDKKFDKHNLILVYDGKASFCCNDQRFDATRGSLVYFKPGDSRLGYTYSDNLMKCFAVDFEYICPVKEAEKWIYEYVSLPFDTHEKITDKYLFSRLIVLFRDLASIWISRKDNMEIRLRAVFSEILHLLLTFKSNRGNSFEKVRKIEEAIHYMVQNLSGNIRLADISAFVGVSNSYLGSIFNEITGKSPIEFLIKMKIDKARDLLRDGVSVTETAFLLGFNDIYYFSKCFKKHEGTNPSEYRRHNISS